MAVSAFKATAGSTAAPMGSALRLEARVGMVVLQVEVSAAQDLAAMALLLGTASHPAHREGLVALVGILAATSSGKGAPVGMKTGIRNGLAISSRHCLCIFFPPPGSEVIVFL